MLCRPLHWRLLFAEIVNRARIEEIRWRGLKLYAAELSAPLDESPVLCIGEEMHGELCIHLVIPAAGMLTIITLILQRLAQRERQRQKAMGLEWFIYSLHLFKLS